MPAAKKKSGFWIVFAVFLALVVLVIPGILSVNVASTASPNVLGKENSDTYTGYIGNTFNYSISYAQASWTIPALKCSSSSTPQGQFIVGFGGWYGGFIYSCVGGKGEYSALYLVDSHYGAIPSGDTIFAGDVMHASVGEFANAWQIILKDKTRGWEIDNVSEGVSEGNIFFFTLAGSVPNPDFGEIKLTNVCVTAVTSCEGLKYYSTGSTFALGQDNWINPATKDILATATNLKGKGSSFTILWNASS
jgi:hypothetical protein